MSYTYIRQREYVIFHDAFRHLKKIQSHDPPKYCSGHCVRSGLDVSGAVFNRYSVIKKSYLRYFAILSKYGTKEVMN